MNINDILMLCKAGFTAEQIGKMSAVQPDTTPVEPDTPPVEPKTPPVEPKTPPVEPKTPPVQPEPKDTPDEPVKKKKKDVTAIPAPASDNSDLVSAIEDLKQIIVNSNITNSNQPAPKVDTVESIINTMIGGNQ